MRELHFGRTSLLMKQWRRTRQYAGLVLSIEYFICYLLLCYPAYYTSYRSSYLGPARVVMTQLALKLSSTHRSLGSDEMRAQA